MCRTWWPSRTLPEEARKGVAWVELSMYVEVARVGHLVEEGAEEVVEVLLEALGEEKSHIVQTSKEVIPGFNRLVEMLGEKIQRSGGHLG